MMQWVIEISNNGRVRVSMKIAQLERELWNRPAMKVFLEAHEVDKSSVLGLCGLAVKQYEIKYNTKPKMTGSMMREFGRNMQTWVSEDETWLVEKSIMALFSSRDLGWVRNPLQAVFDREFRYKHILPIVDKIEAEKLKKGEQSEFRKSAEEFEL